MQSACSDSAVGASGPRIVRGIAIWIDRLRHTNCTWRAGLRRACMPAGKTTATEGGRLIGSTSPSAEADALTVWP